MEQEQINRTEWRTFRYRWLPLCLFIYTCSAPVLVFTSVIFMPAFFRGNSDATVVTLGVVVMVVITPFMAYVITRVMFLQVSEIGLRRVTNWPGLRSAEPMNRVIEWQAIQQITRWPGKMYTIRGPGFAFGSITIAAWLIERPGELHDFADKFARPEIARQFLT